MVTTSTEYEGDLRCALTHDPSGTKMITDAPVDNHGKGESFSPTDLFASSLATCIITIMGIQASFLKVDLTGLTAKTSKEMATDKPRRISKISIELNFPHALPDKERGLIEKAVENCPVHHSLNPEIEKEITFNWPQS